MLKFDISAMDKEILMFDETANQPSS